MTLNNVYPIHTCLLLRLHQSSWLKNQNVTASSDAVYQPLAAACRRYEEEHRLYGCIMEVSSATYPAPFTSICTNDAVFNNLIIMRA